MAYEVNSGVIDTGTILNNDDVQYVHSGGSAVGTVVSASVNGNYDDEDVTATQIVEAGGVTSSVTLSGEWDWYDDWENPWLIYASGVQHVLSGGSAFGTTVNGYGYQYVSSGGYASGTTVDGGSLWMASGATVTDLSVISGRVTYDLGATAKGTAYGSSFSINNGVGTGLWITTNLDAAPGRSCTTRIS